MGLWPDDPLSLDFDMAVMMRAELTRQDALAQAEAVGGAQEIDLDSLGGRGLTF